MGSQGHEHTIAIYPLIASLSYVVVVSQPVSDACQCNSGAVDQFRLLHCIDKAQRQLYAVALRQASIKQ